MNKNFFTYLSLLSLMLLIPGFVYADFVDNGDGTVTDTQTGLMWTKKDSWPDKKAINWNESKSYVRSLSTGGYVDWRVPTISELQTIIKSDYKNISSYRNFTTHIHSIFAPGGAAVYWSLEEAGSCCAYYIIVYKEKCGEVGKTVRGNRQGFGVRAVRNMAKNRKRKNDKRMARFLQYVP